MKHRLGINPQLEIHQEAKANFELRQLPLRHSSNFSKSSVLVAEILYNFRCYPQST